MNKKRIPTQSEITAFFRLLRLGIDIPGWDYIGQEWADQHLGIGYYNSDRDQCGSLPTELDILAMEAMCSRYLDERSWVDLDLTAFVRSTPDTKYQVILFNGGPEEIYDTLIEAYAKAVTYTKKKEL